MNEEGTNDSKKNDKTNENSGSSPTPHTMTILGATVCSRLSFSMSRLRSCILHSSRFGQL